MPGERFERPGLAPRLRRLLGEKFANERSRLQETFGFACSKDITDLVQAEPEMLRRQNEAECAFR